MSTQTGTGKPRRVAVLGCGTVGREVAARLVESGERLGVELLKVLVRDAARDRGLPRELFTASIDEIDAAAPDAVVELIGGVEPARSLVERFLGRGVPVVTANKTLIAHHGPALRALAEARGAALACEASVGAAIPIMAALRQLAGDRTTSIRGVVNGSCNFILSRLGDGWAFDDALREARRRGLVEPDPSADISGRDSAEKLCVLAAAVGFTLMPDQVETRGIEGLTPEDLAAARRSGRAIKLIAELDLANGAVRARVGPTLLPRAHPLAQVEEEENAIAVEAELAGEVFLRGRGAGPKPTASAVLGDLVRLLGSRQQAPAMAATPGAPSPVRRHAVRINRPGLTPERVLAAARSAGAEAVELDLTRAGVRMVVEGATPEQAQRCAAALGEPGAALVMPVV